MAETGVRRNRSRKRGVYAWTSGRTRLLRRANLFFAACVAWNLVALGKV